MADTRTWKPSDGYFGTLLAALLGQASRRVDGIQDSGGGGGYGAGQPVSPDTALKLSSVWACIRLTAEAVGAMPIKVYDVADDGTRTLNKSHWIYSLLNYRPNRYQTRNEFFETVIINLMLAGNSYCYAPKNDAGRVLTLTPMLAPQTEVKWSAGQDRSYVFTNGNDVAAYGQDKVWHLPLMMSNGIMGLSPLQYGARTMGIAIAAEDRVSTLAANGFKPTGVLMIDKALKPEQREQIRAQFSDLQEGKGDPLKVLEAGMTYQAITMSPKDVQLLESRRFQVEDIARFFGVPSVLINDTSATTVWGSGIGEIKEGFYALTLRPLLERIESSMVKWLLPIADRGKIAVEFDFSALLRGNEKDRMETNAASVAGNILTINEARAREGLPPVPNGDVMYAQSQMIPIGSSAPQSGIVDRRRWTTNDDT